MTVTELLEEYRIITAQERSHQVEADQAGLRRSQIIRELKATGMTWATIGEQVGLTRQRCQQLAARK